MYTTSKECRRCANYWLPTHSILPAKRKLPPSRARALVGPGSHSLSARRSKEIIFRQEDGEAMALENIRYCTRIIGRLLWLFCWGACVLMFCGARWVGISRLRFWANLATVRLPGADTLGKSVSSSHLALNRIIDYMFSYTALFHCLYNAFTRGPSFSPASPSSSIRQYLHVVALHLIQSSIKFCTSTST